MLSRGLVCNRLGTAIRRQQRRLANRGTGEAGNAVCRWQAQPESKKRDRPQGAGPFFWVGWLLVQIAGEAQQHRSQHQGDHAHQLDENVHGRTRGVLEGVTNGVAHDRGLVVVTTLAAKMAFLDVLLGVVPGAAAVGHEQGQEGAHDRGAQQGAGQSGWVQG